MEILNRILEIAAVNTLVITEVEPEIADMRMDVCRGCDKLEESSMRCKVCKCFLRVKTKSRENRNPEKFRFEITHCPLGRWNDMELANVYREMDGLPKLI